MIARVLIVGFIAVLAGCSQIFGLEAPAHDEGDGGGGSVNDGSISDGIGDDARLGDGGPDAQIGLWGAPQLINLGSTTGDDDATLTGDMLEMYFNRNGDTYVTTRPNVTSQWLAPALVVELTSTDNETGMEVSSDGLTMTISSDTVPANSMDVWISTRATRQSPWPLPTRIAELNTGASEYAGGIMPNRLRMTVMALNGADYDVWETTRLSQNGSWGAPVSLAFNSGSDDTDSFMLDNALVVYFSSRRGASSDLYVSQRPSVGTAFMPAQPIAELNTGDDDEGPWVSADQRHMFFSSDRSGTMRIYESTR